jgi:hydrogenase maturation protease
MKRDVTDFIWLSNAWPESLLVIGYGNPYRRDDGAGPALAEKLVCFWASQGLFAKLIISTQLEPELAWEIAKQRAGAVVFVDCREQDESDKIQVSSLPQVSEGDWSEGELYEISPSLGHHVGPTTVLLYAALLYGQRPQAWLVTIPGTDFGHGQCFSPEVNQRLMDISKPARQLLDDLKETLYA